MSQRREAHPDLGLTKSDDDTLSRWEDYAIMSPKPHRPLSCRSSPVVCAPTWSIPLRPTSPWFPSSIWGAYSRGMSIRRNNSCCDFEGAVWICPEPTSSRHSNLSNKPLPCSNLIVIERITRQGCPRQDRHGCSRRGHRCGKRVFYQDEGDQEDAHVMVANPNLTWKAHCIEILNYVRPPILPIPFVLD
jgi:hypothetical protein